ncbi:type II toxin-antitoxin system Phd/YefM family antitoxin [Fusobacterium polymorphum]|jgi:prevent-host-death family protein|uniref:type II toxin-antitoxin system Phd/YefM family antitoxin n=1 Tax=Fusobacterium nucleatum subsp. polymorphum TaxID=76857 RepID=UPI003009767A
MEVIGVTKFRCNLKDYFEKVTDEKIDIVIKRQNNQDSIVLISLEKYNELLRGVDNKEK